MTSSEEPLFFAIQELAQQFWVLGWMMRGAFWLGGKIEMSVIIEQNLGGMLSQINHKLENLQKDVTDIKIELTEAKGERQVLKVEIDNLKQDVNAIKSS